MSHTLSESAFWILTALAPGPLHGYAIMRATGEASDGRVALKATTLYASLERLERDHLVEIASEQVVDGRTRRSYQLTEHGGAALARAVAERVVTPERAYSRPSPRSRCCCSPPSR